MSNKETSTSKWPFITQDTVEVLISKYWVMVGKEMLTMPAPKDHRNMPATTVHHTMLLLLVNSPDFPIVLPPVFFKVNFSTINKWLVLWENYLINSVGLMVDSTWG
jgi:hypothetical protein